MLAFAIRPALVSAYPNKGNTPRETQMTKNLHDYYRHTRALAAFPAADCLRMARSAVALDEASRAARLAPAGAASYEVMPDGSAPVRLSFSIKVF